MNTVTVITPCYNSEQFITNCISSVQHSVTLGLFQIEHIVIDDCSTDFSLKKIKTFSKDVVVRSNSQNLGPAESRNIGLNMAKGKYVFFLDADDVLFENSLRYLYETAEKQTSPWVYGDFIKGDRQLKYLLNQDYYGWEFRSTAEVLTAMYTGGHFFQENNLFLRQILLEQKGFSPELSMAEDFELCTRLLLEKIIPSYIPGPLYMHRLHNDNLSRVHLDQPSLHKENIKSLFMRHQQKLEKELSASQLNQIKQYLGIKRFESRRRIY